MATAVTPAMRNHCAAIAAGAQLTRTSLTGQYRMHSLCGTARLTYTMGMKLEQLGLVVFKNRGILTDLAELTDKGKEAANG